VKLSLYVDEDTIARSLVTGLHTRGAKVQTVIDAGLRGKDDRIQLQWAGSHGRALGNAGAARQLQFAALVIARPIGLFVTLGPYLWQRAL
jgi:hypothetical protein